MLLPYPLIFVYFASAFAGSSSGTLKRCDAEGEATEFCFDPSRVSPRGSIRCSDIRPQAFDFGPVNGWDLDTATVQELCAKPEYSGRQPGPEGQQGLSGYCYHNDPRLRRGGLNLPTVRFDKNSRYLAQDMADSLFTPRLALFCRERCFCDKLKPAPFPPLTKKPKNTPFIYQSTTRSLTQQSIWEIQLERRDGGRYLTGNGEALTTIVEIGDQEKELERPNGDSFRASFREVITINPTNVIECLGDNIPYQSLRIPRPFHNEQFHNIASLCATALSGGSPIANAGGYCHDSSKETGLPTGRGDRDVWFTDDMTPREEWTWAANFAFAARVRGFCFSSCWCVGADPIAEHERHRRVIKIGWKLNEFSSVLQLPDGSHGLVSSLGRSSITQAWGSFHGDGTRTSTDRVNCLDEGDCPALAWSIEALGPLPSYPPKTGPGSSSLLRCGQSCVGIAALNCKGSDSAGDCKCIALTQSQTRILGLDPVTVPGIGLCLAAATLVQALRYGGKKRGGLGGRDVYESSKSDLEAELLDLNCVCNATFASALCCESDSGIVHKEQARIVRWGNVK
ncbi:MAG: hypothetical protein M1814_006574 [Vezdaea aestivalis]|nr:MAG: hypothetical protein M1814_006574 [Vezdaea aestivalis]